MGRFKEKLSEIAPFGPLIAAFTAGFTIASLIWLLSYFYPTQDQKSEFKEYRNKYILLKDNFDNNQNQLTQKNNENIQLKNIINEKERDINLCKNSLNSNILENEQLKNKLSKIEAENKRLTQQAISKSKQTIPSSPSSSEQNDQKIIKHEKIVPLPTPSIQNEEYEIATIKPKTTKTVFSKEVFVIEHGTSSILDDAFFITVNNKSKSGIDAIIRARGYPDVKIEKGQAGQDYILRCVKTYEIRILDIGVYSNIVKFFVREI